MGWVILEWELQGHSQHVFRCAFSKVLKWVHDGTEVIVGGSEFHNLAMAQENSASPAELLALVICK